MKLIEKLADQYYQERPEGFADPREDFMTGFRKAREMAVALAQEEGFEAYPHGPESWEQIEKLGEQEAT